MKELLNKLIEKGYIPFGRYGKLMTYGQDGGIKVFGFGVLGECEYSLRELVSKESGLRQFVCENRLWKDIDEEKYWHKKTPKMSELRSYDYHFEEYRLIEGSLKDESELEDFLLDNIKV